MGRGRRRLPHGLGLALRGLFDEWAERAGWLIVTLASGAIAWFTAAHLPGDRGYPMLGFAVGGSAASYTCSAT
nr:hypothetical protein GCM10020092_082990 [Actinoplanes digitatis]